MGKLGDFAILLFLPIVILFSDIFRIYHHISLENKGNRRRLSKEIFNLLALWSCRIHCCGWCFDAYDNGFSESHGISVQVNRNKKKQTSDCITQNINPGE